jgi:hypothetical protein
MHLALEPWKGEIMVSKLHIRFYLDLKINQLNQSLQIMRNSEANNKEWSIKVLVGSMLEHKIIQKSMMEFGY